jgi:hypothetical protein
MSNIVEPQSTPEGVAFTVLVDSEKRDCLITTEALQKISALSSSESANAPDIKIFSVHEARINGIARRLVAAGVQGKPLRVEAALIVNHMPALRS